MADGVLDIVAEHPQEQHVAGQMHEIAVQEGIGDIGASRSGTQCRLSGNVTVAIGDGGHEAVEL